MCTHCVGVYIPTELPSCTPPLVVGCIVSSVFQTANRRRTVHKADQKKKHTSQKINSFFFLQIHTVGNRLPVRGAASAAAASAAPAAAAAAAAAAPNGRLPQLLGDQAMWFSPLLLPLRQWRRSFLLPKLSWKLSSLKSLAIITRLEKADFFFFSFFFGPPEISHDYKENYILEIKKHHSILHINGSTDLFFFLRIFFFLLLLHLLSCFTFRWCHSRNRLHTRFF